MVTVAAAGLHEAHLPGGARLLFRTQVRRNYQLPESSIVAMAARAVALPRAGRCRSGVVTLAWLRAAGRADASGAAA